MMRCTLAVTGAALCAVFSSGCALLPPVEAPRAAVETRRIPEARAASTPRNGSENRSAAAAASGSSRPSDARSDARDSAETELRRTVERQSRRIAELESRPAGDGESRQVVELIAIAQRLNTMSPEDQGRELAAANQDYAREPGLYSRLRVALVLATPGTSFNDDARAVSLLDGVAAQPAKTPLRQLAVLVHGLVGERLREQKRVAQLKEQIDGLRAIDRALIDREPGRAR